MNPCSVCSTGPIGGMLIRASLVLLVAIVPWRGSVAQDTPPGSQAVLEEIIVSARKREESLQDAPISIQAFTSEGLELRNISGIAQIGAFTPNMIFDTAASIGGSNSSAIVYIRGIGQDAAIPTIDLGVGTYVDGVYLARSVGSVFELVDVERIEVLRGPQGTLFGRNTIGGAVNVVTRKPTEVSYTDVALEAGSDSLLSGRVTVNGAVTDNLLGKLSVLSRQRDGYVLRPDGADFGDENSIAGRLDLRWLAGDQVTVDLSLDATSSDTNGAAWTLVDVAGNAPFPQYHNAFLVPPSSGCFVPPPMGPGTTDSQNPLCYNANWIPADIDTDYGSLEPKDELDVFGVAATVSWDLENGAAFKSITSYRDTESVFNIDQDHSPLQVAEVSSETWQDQFTQEFQFLGDGAGGALNYILGLYYFEENGAFLEHVRFSPVFIRSGGAIRNDSKAVFAQVTYDLTDALSVTAGLRYTDDTKRFTPDQVVYSNNNDSVPPPLLGFEPGQVPPMPPPGARILPNVRETIDVQETTPQLTFSYRWNDAFMTYLGYSEGFKSGGFTQRVFPPEAVIPWFNPEYVDAYEIGFKLQTAQNRLRLNGAYFYMDYTDLQIVSQAETVAPVVLNAGAAEISGFELDLQAAPGGGWLVEASVGHLKADYTELDPSTGLSLDNELVKAPKWSGVLGLAHTAALAGGGGFTTRLDYMYKGDYYNNAINSAVLRQSSFGLLNAGLAYDSADGRWMLKIYGENLTDERYISAGYSEQNGPTLNLGTSEVVRDRGRTWGLAGRYRFE